MTTSLSDDRFEAELRTLLHSATTTLEPGLGFQDVDVLSLTDSHPSSRPWARAGAIGLTAAAAVTTIVWIGGDEAPRVSSPSTPSVPADVIDPAMSLPTVDGAPTTATDPDTTEDLAPAAFDPANILFVGLDRRVDCVPSDSPYAGGIPVHDIGARGDTIMVLRLDPGSGTASVLSFPRDLWVTIPNRDGKNRLDAAVIENDPTRLLGTLYNEFGVEVDHFVQLDYCGVTALVDAVGGVGVPFPSPARDQNTGLSITEPGCVRLDGLAALAYLRSRHLELQLPDGTWQVDPTSDLGRISRQQDVLLRLLEAWHRVGPTDVVAARQLITTMQEHLVVDQGLTLSRMLEIAAYLGTLERGEVQSFTIEATGANVGGQSVLLPRIDGEHMQAVLARFRGETIETDDADDADGTDVVSPESNPIGIVPDPAVAC